MEHVPVLKKEVLEFLNLKANQNFIDCTVNGGGHALGVLEKNGPEGKVLGIDLDEEVLKNLEFRIKNTEFEKRLIAVHGNYKDLREIAGKNNFSNISGILFDLGMSSWHVDGSKRGFTFKKEEVLDMRYDKTGGITAEEIVNKFSGKELERIFREFGEERFSRKIAEKIVGARQRKPIKTTNDLARVIEQAGQGVHPMRVFQALRIAVNDELGNIQKALPEALEILGPRGRLAVISFHSLEDRIVKNFFQENQKKGLIKILTKKPLAPSFAEIAKNPRARSAKLRAAEKY